MITHSFERSNDLRGHGQLQVHVTNEAITPTFEKSHYIPEQPVKPCKGD
jgi:hypothetical protein